MKKENSLITFHGDDVVPSPMEEALFHVLPVPYEHSVSYGTGTAEGPRAILEASAQLELFACGAIPSEYGIHTAPPIDCSGPCQTVFHAIEEKVCEGLRANSLPVILGGEHSVTLGVINGLQSHYNDFGVIQFDAHADLRDSYEGSRFSHACVMRRIHELQLPIFQLGTRSYSFAEHQYRMHHNIPYLDSEDIWRDGPQLKLPTDFPQHVYITFDIDGLDSGVLPATGTPVPGGLNWYQAMTLLEQIMERCICIGFDVVELAPIPSLHASSFAAAQLTYNMMAYLTKSSRNKRYWLENR